MDRRKATLCVPSKRLNNVPSRHRSILGLSLVSQCSVCVADTTPQPSPPADDEAAWRALWAGALDALDALRREPRLNRTREHVRAQLGAAAYLHCPVADLADQGVPLHDAHAHLRRKTHRKGVRGRRGVFVLKRRGTGTA